MIPLSFHLKFGALVWVLPAYFYSKRSTERTRSDLLWTYLAAPWRLPDSAPAGRILIRAARSTAVTDGPTECGPPSRRRSRPAGAASESLGPRAGTAGSGPAHGLLRC